MASGAHPFRGRPKPSQHGGEKCFNYFVVCSWNYFAQLPETSCQEFSFIVSPKFYWIKLNLSISCLSSFSNFAAQPPRLVTLHLMGRAIGPLLGFGKRKIQQFLLLSSKVDEVGSHAVFLAPTQFVHAESLLNVIVNKLPSVSCRFLSPWSCARRSSRPGRPTSCRPPGTQVRASLCSTP